MRKWVSLLAPRTLTSDSYLPLTTMIRLQQGPSSRDVEEEPTCTKIYYASRTHSQLSQVLLELKKLNIALNVAVPSAEMPPASDDPRPGGKRSASSIDVDPPDGEGSGPRAVSLGSRKQLCIHERLRARAGDIDEACRQMLGGGCSSFSVLHSLYCCCQLMATMGQRRERSDVPISPPWMKRP